MGVSGSGKSTIGKKLADELKIPFFDGDDFHPQTNIRKMASGQPLNDEDRLGWLKSLNKLAADQLKNNSLVISCSALKEKYRQILSDGLEQNCKWIFLHGSKETIALRMSKRKDHFMPENLLQSQFETLEEPAYGIPVDIEMTPKEIINKILNQLKHEC